MSDHVSQIRTSYVLGELNEAELPGDPIALFGVWMNAAVAAGIVEPNAMALGTVSPLGEPNSRFVLLRDFDARGFVFYTNYESAKAEDLLANPRAALTFWWRELERQVRINGTVTKVDRAESEAYFRSRPRGHQLSSWVSYQSRPIVGREELEQREQRLAARFAESPEIPLPHFWGGYRVQPNRIEFWQGRQNRLHDRFQFLRQDAGWTVSRLAP